MRQLQLRKIGVRNLQRWWMTPLVVVEMLGGLEPSRRLILPAIAMGKPVVTANKAVIAHHGVINAAAAQAGVSVLMEAAVGGGIPIIDPLKQSLGANRIQVMGTERNSGKPGPRLATGRVQSVKRTTE